METLKRRIFTALCEAIVLVSMAISFAIVVQVRGYVESSVGNSAAMAPITRFALAEVWLPYFLVTFYVLVSTCKWCYGNEKVNWYAIQCIIIAIYVTMYSIYMAGYSCPAWVIKTTV